MPDSVFDAGAFNARLFYPIDDNRPAPTGSRDVMIPVQDGVRVHARIHPAPTPQVGVLLFHGNGELVADYDVFAPRYQRAGATLAVVDFRGYGQSEGYPTLRTVVGDAPRVVDGVGPLLEGPTGRLPLVVVGRSVGSACAAEIAGRNLPGVAGIVFESAFGDLAAFVARRQVRTDGPLPEQDWEAFCPLRKLARCRQPLLFLHGACDRLIEPNEAQLLFDAAASADKKLVYVDGHGHNDVMQATSYWEALTSFLKRF